VAGSPGERIACGPEAGRRSSGGTATRKSRLRARPPLLHPSPRRGPGGGSFCGSEPRLRTRTTTDHREGVVPAGHLERQGGNGLPLANFARRIEHCLRGPFLLSSIVAESRTRAAGRRSRGRAETLGELVDICRRNGDTDQAIKAIHSLGAWRMTPPAGGGKSRASLPAVRSTGRWNTRSHRLRRLPNFRPVPQGLKGGP